MYKATKLWNTLDHDPYHETQLKLNYDFICPICWGVYWEPVKLKTLIGQWQIHLIMTTGWIQPKRKVQKTAILCRKMEQYIV